MPAVKLSYAVAIAAYCAGIYFLSSQSDLGPPEWSPPGVDKSAHFVIFGGLCALVSESLRRSNSNTPWQVRYAVPVCFTILYGLFDETHQLFVPGREFDLWDLAADAAGAVAVVVGMSWWAKRVATHRRMASETSGP